MPNNNTTTVSMHAVDRFGERVLNLNQVRSELIADSIKLYIHKILLENFPNHEQTSHGEFKFKDYGITVIKKNYVIVTVEPLENSTSNDFNYSHFKTANKKERNDAINTRKQYFVRKETHRR